MHNNARRIDLHREIRSWRAGATLITTVSGMLHLCYLKDNRLLKMITQKVIVEWILDQQIVLREISLAYWL